MKSRRQGRRVDEAEMKNRRKLAKKKEKISNMRRKIYVRILAVKQLRRLLDLQGVNTSSIHDRDKLNSIILTNLGVKTVIKVVVEAKRKRRSILCGCPTETRKNIKQLQMREENMDVFQRNWLDLPHDILSLIFTKIGVLEILLTAQMVCSTWHHLSKQPHLFQFIEIQNKLPKYFGMKRFCTYVKILIKRSCGQMVRFSCSHTLIPKVALASHCKSCLPNILAEAAKELSQLEHLHLHYIETYFTVPMLQEIGVSCHKLKHLHIDFKGRQGNFQGPDETFVIARYMPHLQNLHITYSTITTGVLLAIIAGCPLLKYIFLRGCHNIKLERPLMKKSGGRIKRVRLQNGEYEIDLATCGVSLAMSESDYQEFEDIYNNHHNSGHATRE